jgi:hypothetical protein
MIAAAYSHLGRFCLATLILVFASIAALAQDDARARLDKYESVATESVEITLDGPVLRFAAAALSESDPEQRKAKALLNDVRAIYVRSFEFDRDGAYERADVDALRARFRGPGWSRIADVKSRRYENAEVYVSMEGAAIKGLAVIATDARELTFVHIDGSIRPEQLSELEGRFSIPRMKLSVNFEE